MKTILLADDHKNIREYCRATFAEDGYRVVLASDGVEALEMFITEMPDLAILDISMPRASGLDTLEQIKGLSPDTPVILFTAHDVDCLRDHRALLATACVEKGDNLAELKRVIARTLKRPIAECESDILRRGLPPCPAQMERAGRPSPRDCGTTCFPS